MQLTAKTMSSYESFSTRQTLIYGATMAAAGATLGYWWATRKGQGSGLGIGKRVVAKSYENTDEVKSHCVQNSSPLTEVQKKLLEQTIQHPRAIMMGAPEIISLNQLLIRALAAQKVIDIGNVQLFLER